MCRSCYVYVRRKFYKSICDFRSANSFGPEDDFLTDDLRLDRGASCDRRRVANTDGRQSFVLVSIASTLCRSLDTAFADVARAIRRRRRVRTVAEGPDCAVRPNGVGTRVARPTPEARCGSSDRSSARSVGFGRSSSALRARYRLARRDSVGPSLCGADRTGPDAPARRASPLRRCESRDETHDSPDRS